MTTQRNIKEKEEKEEEISDEDKWYMVWLDAPFHGAPGG
jgi:hypothetical protein